MKTWNILAVDDDETSVSSIKDLLERRAVSSQGDRCRVETTTSFTSALNILEHEQYDLLILDIRDQGMAASQGLPPDGNAVTAADRGLDAYEAIKQKRFVPVVFHTALPDLAADLHSPPFTSVVSKLDEDEAKIRKAVMEAFDSGLPELNRALSSHVESLHRQFMSEFVRKHWSTFGGRQNQGDLAHLLVRRLAMSLTEGAPALAPYLDAFDYHGTDNSKIHPMRMYIVPPVGSWTTGDILEYSADSKPQLAADEEEDRGDVQDTEVQETATHYWVMLTPACDLVEDRRKAEFVVMARCLPLEDTPEYRKWSSQTSSNGGATTGAISSMEKLIGNNRGGQRERFYFLPAAWDTPNLVVDFQQIIHVEYEKILESRRLATLDSPYSQSLISQFTRYLGRMGTPDLSIKTVMQRLQSSLASDGSEDLEPTA
ncbi:response regulator [Streptomyces griseorubiginosus]|uniref:response regulator n=1 Tax=Streptomyces griseorubiginosus TaxID=67304 RepID=UPI00362CC358